MQKRYWIAIVRNSILKKREMLMNFNNFIWNVATECSWRIASLNLLVQLWIMAIRNLQFKVFTSLQTPVALREANSCSSKNRKSFTFIFHNVQHNFLSPQHFRFNLLLFFLFIELTFTDSRCLSPPFLTPASIASDSIYWDLIYGWKAQSDSPQVLHRRQRFISERFFLRWQTESTADDAIVIWHAVTLHIRSPLDARHFHQHRFARNSIASVLLLLWWLSLSFLLCAPRLFERIFFRSLLWSGFSPSLCF